jgi:predicted dienelactone hydrolase
MTVPAAAVLLALTALAACGHRDDAEREGVSGLRHLSFHEPTRARTIPADLWYPADPSSREAELALAGIFRAAAALDAPREPSGGRLPLILLSHGSGGGRADQAWLASRLARRGYVVAAVEHPGNRFGDDSPAGTVAVWRRPPDLSFALDRLLADEELGAWIDPGRIGAAGHSSGGYTVIALAGAIYDADRIATYCSGPEAGPDCELASELDPAELTDLADAGRSFRDGRIRAAFAMAPAVAQGFDETGLAAVSIPVRIVGSLDDELTLFRLNAQRYAELVPGATLATVRPGGHFVYMSVCNSLGREVAALVCVDPDPTTERAAVHERVAGEALAFFAEHLR